MLQSLQYSSMRSPRRIKLSPTGLLISICKLTASINYDTRIYLHCTKCYILRYCFFLQKCVYIVTFALQRHCHKIFYLDFFHQNTSFEVIWANYDLRNKMFTEVLELQRVKVWKWWKHESVAICRNIHPQSVYRSSISLKGLNSVYIHWTPRCMQPKPGIQGLFKSHAAT